MSKVRDKVKLRVNIAGFAGPAASIYCGYDPNTDMLLVGKAAELYEGTRRAGFLHITNQDRDAAVDAVFSNEDMMEAITAYFELEALGLLVIAAESQRFNPQSKIERDGLDTGGPKYRVAPDMSNGQVAVLVACRYAKQQRSIAESLDAFSEILSITTI
jgi:hypothetical protein